MVDRLAHKTGERFWGYINYPRCKYTQPMTRVAASSVWLDLVRHISALRF